MTDAEIKRAITARIKETIRAIEQHEREYIARAAKLLGALRLEIIARIAENSSEFDASVLRQLKNAIEASLQRFEHDATIAIQQDLRRAFDLGAQLVESPVAVVNTSSSLVVIDRASILVAAEHSADLIRDLTAEVRTGVNAILRRGLLGVISKAEAIKLIGARIDKPGSLFNKPSARAATIWRTETYRMQAISTHARMIENERLMRGAGYTLKRRWLSAQDLRVRGRKKTDEFSHALADGQIRAINEPFDIPILLKGVPVGSEPLEYPRDPNGSPGNTINCRCLASPVIERTAA
ncbi:MAG TPA: hypothetical protein VF747_06630 [Blastocatellia bacterium]|jgi:uncharacterized protein with gpF-like domain